MWVTVLEMNVQAALDAGAPDYLPLNNFDVEAPANINDIDLENTPGELEPYPDDVVTDTSLQRCLLGSLESRMAIINSLNGQRSEFEDDEAHALGARITTCYHKLGRNATGEQAAFIRNLADLHLRRLLLPLYASRVRAHKETSCSARKHGLDTALALLSPVPDKSFSQLCIFGGGMFRHRLIHLSLTLCSELLLEVSEHGAAAQEPCGYRRMLMEALHEARRQWRERMLVCETNIKIYAKLGILISEAEAVNDTPSSAYERMARTVKASLEEGYATLQARAPLQIWDQDEMTAEGLLERYDFDDLWWPAGDWCSI